MTLDRKALRAAINRLAMDDSDVAAGVAALQALGVPPHHTNLDSVPHDGSDEAAVSVCGSLVGEWVDHANAADVRLLARALMLAIESLLPEVNGPREERLLKIYGAMCRAREAGPQGRQTAIDELRRLDVVFGQPEDLATGLDIFEHSAGLFLEALAMPFDRMIPALCRTLPASFASIKRGPLPEPERDAATTVLAAVRKVFDVHRELVAATRKAAEAPDGETQP